MYILEEKIWQIQILKRSLGPIEYSASNGIASNLKHAHLHTHAQLVYSSSSVSRSYLTGLEVRVG